MENKPPMRTVKESYDRPGVERAFKVETNVYDGHFETSHYALGMKPDVLWNWAGETVENVRLILGDKVLPVFCFAGYSGSAHATALTLRYFQTYGPEFGMMYVRKENEQSHGERVEHNLWKVINSEKPFILVFVDEQVSSGNTRTRVIANSRRCVVDRAILLERTFDKRMDNVHYICALNGETELRYVRDAL